MTQRKKLKQAMPTLPRKQQDDSRRQTRSAGSGDLLTGLPNEPAPWKQHTEDSPPSSGESTASKLPPLIINPGAQAKRRKGAGSSSTPDVQDPEILTPNIPDSHIEPFEAAKDAPEEAPPQAEPAAMDIETPEVHPESAPKPPSPRSSTQPMASHEEVIVIGAAYEPPTSSRALSKHIKEDETAPSKEEKTPSDLSNLDKLTADELYSGYLSRLFASRDMEASMIAKMNAKYEEYLNAADLVVTDLKKSLAQQQTGRAETKEKWRLCSIELEKVKTEFETFKQNAESSQTALMATLSRSLSYAPELNPDEMMDGFPQLKDDGSQFTQEDYTRCHKASRILASRLAAEADLSVYQAAYSADNKHIQGPTFEAKSLVPQCRKHLFAPDVDPSPIMHDEAMFEALTNCNWDVDNLPIEEIEDPAQDDPVAS